MQEMDCVEVIVEKEEYTTHGVHRGMQGWICHPPTVAGFLLVDFPQCGEHDDIAMISVAEADLKQIPVLDSGVNERIREQFGE